jgi:hypothetical protein
MDSRDTPQCRVCGLQLDEPPWGHDGRAPLYEHCPCCGVEFGYQDATPAGAKKFREAWLAAGGNWDEPQQKPQEWDASKQLAHVPERFR